jgi:hypothetical protein
MVVEAEDVATSRGSMNCKTGDALSDDNERASGQNGQCDSPSGLIKQGCAAYDRHELFRAIVATDRTRHRLQTRSISAR